MASVLSQTSHTFDEYLILPGLTKREHRSDTISLDTQLAREKNGRHINLKIPFASAVMQAVTGVKMAQTLGQEGGIGFIYQSQQIDDQARMVKEVKTRWVLVGAGINTRDYRERVWKLFDAGVDALCIDASDGYSEWQADAIQYIQDLWTDVPVVAGNIVDARAFRFLVDAGADAVKVGIWWGQICTTRLQKAIGRGQASALLDVAEARDAYFQQSGIYIPLASDGGATEDYHNTLALAMGADWLMHGRLFAACDESPAQKLKVDGQDMKEYWGEWSARARAQGNTLRYDGALFEEGVDSLIPATGPVGPVLQRIMAKIRATMVSSGVSNFREFHEHAVLTLISQASFQEGGTSKVRVRN